MAFDRRGCGHRGADEVRAAPGALTAFKISIRRGGAALARLKPVGVHREAHRAARLAPLEASGLEYLIQAFAFGLLLHEAGTRHDHREPDVRCDLAAEASHDRRRFAHVFDSRVGARADEHLVDHYVGDRLVRLDRYVLQRAYYS